MKYSLALAFAVALVPLAAVARSHAPPPTATPLPSATPVDMPTEDPAVTKIAKQQFVAWQAGVLKRSLYSPTVQAQMTATVVTETSKQLGSLGALLEAKFIGPVVSDSAPANSANYLYLMSCERGAVYMQFAVLPDGKIGGMVFRKNPPGT